jgi:hypothetical protein
MRSTRSGSTGRLRRATSTEPLQLLAVERNAPAGALYHGQLPQLHALERREATAAIGQMRRRRIAPRRPSGANP